MIKKFFAKLVGYREQVGGQNRFHQQEQIQRELAEERRQVAIQLEHERMKNEMKKRKAPSDSVIFGPSEKKES